MDIEGSEYYVFEKHLEWIKNTKCMILEMHDRFIPGTTKKIENILNEMDFSKSEMGENKIYYNRDVEIKK